MRRQTGQSPPGTAPEQLELPLWSELPSTAEPPSLVDPLSAARQHGDAPSTESPGPDPNPPRSGEVAPARASPIPESEVTSSRPGSPPSSSMARGPGGEARLSDLVPRFLEFATAIDRSPHTIQTTRIDLALLIRFLGDRRVAQVDLDDLRRYASWLRSERKNDARSLRRKVASVKAFFGYCKQIGICADDPAERLIYPSSEPHLPEFLEDDEAAALFAAAERPLWRALILTLLDTGLKRDELLALHPADVYVDPATGDQGYLTVRAANEARRIRARTLPLTPRLAAELRRQIDTGAGDRLFPISVRAVNAIVETTGQRASLRKRGPVSPQMLRDTFAVREVRARIAEEDRQRKAGASERELVLLRLRHDLEVCDLLGLTPGGMNDPIARYRVLAVPGSAIGRSRAEGEGGVTG